MDSILSYFSISFGPKSTCLITFVILIMIYFNYKLNFWKRQGIPNIILHNYKLLTNEVSKTDFNCIKTNGKVVGYVIFVN